MSANFQFFYEVESVARPSIVARKVSFNFKDTWGDPYYLGNLLACSLLTL